MKRRDRTNEQECSYNAGKAGGARYRCELAPRLDASDFFARARMRADDSEKVNKQRRPLSRGGRRGGRSGLAIGREVVTRSFTPRQIGRSRLDSSDGSSSGSSFQSGWPRQPIVVSLSRSSGQAFQLISQVRERSSGLCVRLLASGCIAARKSLPNSKIRSRRRCLSAVLRSS